MVQLFDGGTGSLRTTGHAMEPSCSVNLLGGGTSASRASNLQCLVGPPRIGLLILCVTVAHTFLVLVTKVTMRCSATVSFELFCGLKPRRLERRCLSWIDGVDGLCAVPLHTQTHLVLNCFRYHMRCVRSTTARSNDDDLRTSRLVRSFHFGDEDRPTVSRRFMPRVWRSCDDNGRTCRESSHRPNLC